MIAQFRRKSPANIILLLILALLIKMPLFLHPKNIEAGADDGRLYRYFLALISGNQPNAGICSLVAFLLLYGQALLLNYLMNEYRMIGKQTFLPAMSYLFVTSLIPEWNYLSAPLLASTLLIWGFIRLFRLYNLPYANASVYNLGLIIGLSAFIYFPSVVFVLCILLGLSILRPFRINDLILLLLGVLTPAYFYLAYLYLNDKLEPGNLIPQLAVQVPVLPASVWMVAAMVFLGVPFLIGGFYVQAYLHKMLIQVRKNWGMLLFYLLLALLIPFIETGVTLQNWVLAAAPLAAFHAGNYLYPQNRKFPFVLFIVTLAFILARQYAPPFWLHWKM